MKDRPALAKVIRGDHQEAAQWQPPSVGVEADSRITDVAPEEIDFDQEHVEEQSLITAAQLEEVTQAAHEEGFEQGRKEGQEFGHQEGLEEGRQQIAEKLAVLESIVNVLDKPFETLDEQVESQIATLIVSMVRQLIRREIKMDPKHIIGVVREALSVLPVNARNIKVVLNPEDAEIIREAYAVTDSEQEWHIAEDPVLARGGCRVRTQYSQVDASLESRLNTLIAPLLLGNREEDSEDGPVEESADVNSDNSDNIQEVDADLASSQNVSDSTSEVDETDMSVGDDVVDENDSDDPLEGRRIEDQFDADT